MNNNNEKKNRKKIVAPCGKPSGPRNLTIMSVTKTMIYADPFQ